MVLTYTKGDATVPQGSGSKVICHCCNDEGGWGSGFVVALSDRWMAPEIAYREWYRNDETPVWHPLNSTPRGNTVPFELGQVQFVQVEPGLWVANILGQHKTISSGEKTPIRYEAIADGLQRVSAFCHHINASVHMPRMGAGLARGDWKTIEHIIQKTLTDLPVTVYDWP